MSAARSASSPAASPGLVVEPSVADYRHDGARYARLAAVLRDQGWDAQVTVNLTERRSAVTELVVRLLDQAAPEALDALARTLTVHVSASLERRRSERGRVVIYGSDDAVLQIVEVAGPEPAPAGAERRGAHKRS
jgi:hypothetical protein